MVVEVLVQRSGDESGVFAQFPFIYGTYERNVIVTESLE